MHSFYERIKRYGSNSSQYQIVFNESHEVRLLKKELQSIIERRNI